MCGNQFRGNKKFHVEQNVNTARNRKAIAFSTNNKDFKREPITCSMKAFVKSLKRMSRLPTGTPWARSCRIIQPEPGEDCVQESHGKQGRRPGVGPRHRVHVSHLRKGTGKTTLPLYRFYLYKREGRKHTQKKKVFFF